MDAQPQAIDDDVTTAFLGNLPSLERYARSLTRDEEASADVCQEVFIKLLVTARAGRMPDVPGAWMHRVAHNIVVSSARRKSTSDRTLERLAQSEQMPSTEDEVIRREQDAFAVGRRDCPSVPDRRSAGPAPGDDPRGPRLRWRRDRRSARSDRTGDPDAPMPCPRRPQEPAPGPRSLVRHAPCRPITRRTIVGCGPR